MEEIIKIELPVSATPEIMELLIKAKHFFSHATVHAQSGNAFDSMISIHSLDNSIEYLLRIIIKHLEIEEKLLKTINTPELMAIFSEVDRFLKEWTLFDGKGIGLPYENEIRQLRTLRNNVQHGMILPVSELKSFIMYGERFFEKVLKKIFGLTLQEISYSVLIEDSNIKAHLNLAETKIDEGKYLEAVVACRDAFELGEFLLQNNSHHINKMAVIPYIKQESMELYYYIQSLDEEISILGTQISISDYRLYLKYIDHIPSQYRANKSGYSVMQRDWEKKDADFCYVFVSQAILNWQMTQERPLYEVDMFNYPIHKRELSINGVLLPELYVEKTCIYLNDAGWGELRFISGETKAQLATIKKGDVCKLNTKNTVESTGVLINEYSQFIIIDAIEFNLVLNNGPLWELMIYYREVPFTTISNIDEQIDIDKIQDFSSKNDEEDHVKQILLEYGSINTLDSAIELNKILIDNEIDPLLRTSSYSSNLISLLGKNVLNADI